MTNLNPVTPQANVSLSLYETVADDTASAFLKYNVHQHNPAVLPSFLAYDIRVGDPVYMYNLQGVELFPQVEPAVVTYITRDTLVISQSATEDAVNSILYYGAPRGDARAREVQGVNISAFSQSLSFYATVDFYNYTQAATLGRSGVITPKQGLSLLHHTVPLSLNLHAGVTTYVLVPYVGIKGWLSSISAYSYDYTGSAQFLRYFYEDPLQDVEDANTWQVISPQLDLAAGLRSRVACMEETLAVFPEVYPLDRAATPCYPNDMLALQIVGTDPSQGYRLQLALHFDKVLD
jgi:hypothetical protein